MQSKVSNIDASRRQQYSLAAAAAAASFVSPLRSSSHSAHGSEVFDQNNQNHHHHRHPAGKANRDARSIWVGQERKYFADLFSILFDLLLKTDLLTFDTLNPFFLNIVYFNFFFVLV